MKLLLVALAVASAGDFGQLVVRSQPGAEVLWDGVSLGPIQDDGELTIEGILPGSYSLSLRREGFTTYEQTLQVKAGTTNLTLPLVPAAIEHPAGDSSGRFALSWLLAGAVLLAAGAAAAWNLTRRSRRASPRRHRRLPGTPWDDRAPAPSARQRSAGFLAGIEQRERRIHRAAATVPRDAPDDVIEGEIIDPVAREGDG
ncbi:MAG TPA: PEGA domain-containing protein [Thermoanaerobaculia bacterium]|nr:PEGA domain-containing protein [Thermoanaerobaculia bacterium]